MRFHAISSAVPILCAGAVHSQTVDSSTFGNSSSESSHSFTATESAVITGGLGESARQLLPATPAGVYGGQMTFVMAVDPVKWMTVCMEFLILGWRVPAGLAGMFLPRHHFAAGAEKLRVTGFPFNCNAEPS